MKRAIIIVLDSVGIGELPDAYKFGDEGSNTLVNIKKAIPDMELKNMCSLGLCNIDGDEIQLLGKCDNPIGCFGKMAEKSMGKDTTTGHLEIAGIITEKPYPVFTKTGFPESFIKDFEKAIGRKVIGNYAESGTKIINDLGEEHIKTGFPIVYTSADSVFQIAAHEEIIPLEKLYEICEIAREMLVGDLGVGRVIARPFIGTPNNFTRTKNRRDYALIPKEKTLLDVIKESGKTVAAVGKTEDIFAHRGMTLVNHTTNNHDGIEKTIDFINKTDNGLIFTNLVDYDMLYGHRNDPLGYANALMEFDKKLPDILNSLKEDDLLIITADHGCDPTTVSTDHSREYVPLLVYGKNFKKGVNLGIRDTFSDIACTVSEYLMLDHKFFGKSFLGEIKKDT